MYHAQSDNEYRIEQEVSEEKEIAKAVPAEAKAVKKRHDPEAGDKKRKEAIYKRFLAGSILRKGELKYIARRLKKDFDLYQIPDRVNVSDTMEDS